MPCSARPSAAKPTTGRSDLRPAQPVRYGALCRWRRGGAADPPRPAAGGTSRTAGARQRLERGDRHAWRCTTGPTRWPLSRRALGGAGLQPGRHSAGGRGFL